MSKRSSAPALVSEATAADSTALDSPITPATPPAAATDPGPGRAGGPLKLAVINPMNSVLLTPHENRLPVEIHAFADAEGHAPAFFARWQARYSEAAAALLRRVSEDSAKADPAVGEAMKLAANLEDSQKRLQALTEKLKDLEAARERAMSEGFDAAEVARKAFDDAKQDRFRLSEWTKDLTAKLATVREQLADRLRAAVKKAALAELTDLAAKRAAAVQRLLAVLPPHLEEIAAIDAAYDALSRLDVTNLSGSQLLPNVL